MYEMSSHPVEKTSYQVVPTLKFLEQMFPKHVNALTDFNFPQ